MDLFKEKLVDHCRDTMRRKIELVSFAMAELRGSMENETKSALGDKHETSRARMQAEHEKLAWQLEELKAQFEEFYKLDPHRSTEAVSSQNLVITDNGMFLILVPLGKVELEGRTVYVISPASPLGKALLGLKRKEKARINNFSYEVLEIL